MKILITGSNGQLGSKIKDLSSEFNSFEFFYSDTHNLDITKRKAVFDFFENLKPDILVNCAAYTAVDKAEDESALAYKVNADGPENLAIACKKFNTKLIHISTDYVFGDEHKQTPYCEDDFCLPDSVYGKSKLQGEVLVLENIDDAVIIRTSWLYGEYGSNFVKTMLRLANEKTELGVVNDQKGSPTYAGDLAKAILKIISLYKSTSYWRKGIYHFSNLGETSWYEFAKAIFEIKNINIILNPLRSEDFPSKVKRPKYSVLDKSKIINTFGIEIPQWKESLRVLLQKI